MKYIGIVNEIKDNHKSGFYGKKPLTDKEIKDKINETSENFKWLDLLPLPISLLGLITQSLFMDYKLKKIIKKRKENFTKPTTDFNTKITKSNNSESIELQKQIESNNKLLIFTKNSFDNNYSVNNSEYLYGLFEEFPNPNLAFERILKSKGGSELNIMQRKDIPSNLKHINKGHFNEGIYIIHPKINNIMIPLNNSNKLIESLILEETIRAYEALGAKKVIINDITKKEFNANVNSPKGGGGISANYKSELLREKIFGKGTFCPERALENKFFIQDIPSIMTTIEGRIKGNQIAEKFRETINLSVGLDANVLNLYKGSANYNSLREWSFEVEFFDKNEM
jgi:hypothetical protein